MGMYTGLRVKVIVKEKYIPMIHCLTKGDVFAEDHITWSDYVKLYPFLNNFASKPRANMIPNGVLSYMPDEWEDNDSFNNNVNLHTGEWVFKCSLKNYHREIETFLEEVLPEIAIASTHIEYLYEEDEEGTFYTLNQGKIEPLDPKIKKRIDVFNNMFELTKEYDVYKHSYLTPFGLVEDNNVSSESLSAEAAFIHLTDGTEFCLHFGESHDAHNEALSALDVFESFNYDESRFKRYLKEETNFTQWV